MTTKIAITCPNCMIDLGIQVSSSNHSLVFKANDPSIFPGDSGDKSEDDKYFNINKDSTLLRPISYENHSMSYTVLKGCISSPETTAYAHDRNSSIKSRASKSQVEKKPVRKSTFCLKSGTAHPCFLTSHAYRNNEKHDFEKSQSFTVAAAPKNGGDELPVYEGQTSKNIIINDIRLIQVPSETVLAASNLSCPELRLRQVTSPSLHTLQRAVSYTIGNVIGEDALLMGIDKVEVASLYDSSSETSCNESDADEESTSECCVSQDAPELPQRSLQQCSLNVNSQLVDASESESTNEVSGEHANATSSPENIFNFDIPEFRQDLYKNCFVLFLEKWFGKSGY